MPRPPLAPLETEAPSDAAGMGIAEAEFGGQERDGTPATGGRAWRAASTIGVHSVVDTFSFVLVALMPVFTTRLGLTDSQVALLLGVGSITSGVVQPAVAWISDRLDTRVFGTAAMALAVVCIGLMGHAETFTQLLVLQALGALGVGAFHPPAAAAVGAIAGRRRALGMSLFFLAGMLGGMTGNVLSPMYVDLTGSVRSLIWLIPPGMLAVVLLAIAIHPVSHRAHDAHEQHATLSPEDRRERWRVVWILYAGNVLRFTVNMMLVYLLVQWSRRFVRTEAGVLELTEELSVRASALNGPLQASMQIGMGGAGLAAGFLLPVRREKAALMFAPIAGAAAILAIPYTDRLGGESALVSQAMVFCLGVLAGVGFGGLVPVTMSIAQRMLPHRTSLASGLMLGGAWCFAAAGPSIAERVHHHFSLETAFVVTAGTLCVAGLIAVALPARVLERVAHHD